MSIKSITSVLDEFHKKKRNIYNYGENGNKQLSFYGYANIKKTTEEVYIKEAQAALIGLNTYLVRGNNSTKNCIGVDRVRVSNLILETYDKIIKLDTKNQQTYLEYLIILCFNKRDIRGNYGNGERKLSYWFIIELAKLYPDTLSNLLEILPEFGSWLDFKYLYGICCEDLKSETNKDNINILSKIKKKLLEIQYSQLILDEITINENSNNIKQISLLAKWVPKQGSEYSRKYKIDKELAKLYYPNLWKKDFKKACKSLRQLISKLNTAICTTEKYMCANNFADIKFELVPGRCLSKNHLTWLNENENGDIKKKYSIDRNKTRENYLSFINKVKNNTVKTKGKSLFIHEIVNKIKCCILKYHNTEVFKQNEPELYELLNSQFNDHYLNILESSKSFNPSQFKDILFQVDTSGSMHGDPLGVSVGVGVLGSSLTDKFYKNRLITFESIPRWIILEYPDNFHDYQYNYPGYRSNTYPLGNFNQNKIGKELDWIEKITITLGSAWGGSTNFISALNLVSDAAQLSGSKMPSKIVCITDMQWNTADSTSMTESCDYMDSYNSGIKSLYSCVKNWGESSYLSEIDNIENFFQNTFIKGTNISLGMPKLIVWNVRGNQSNVGFITESHDPRVQTVSGFSTSMLKLFLKEGLFKSNSTSWDSLKEILDNEDYNTIKDIIYLTKEKIFQNYKYNNFLEIIGDRSILKYNTNNMPNLYTVSNKNNSLSDIFENNEKLMFKKKKD